MALNERSRELLIAAGELEAVLLEQTGGRAGGCRSHVESVRKLAQDAARASTAWLCRDVWLWTSAYGSDPLLARRARMRFVAVMPAAARSSAAPSEASTSSGIGRASALLVPRLSIARR